VGPALLLIPLAGLSAHQYYFPSNCLSLKVPAIWLGLKQFIARWICRHTDITLNYILCIFGLAHMNSWHCKQISISIGARGAQHYSSLWYTPSFRITMVWQTALTHPKGLLCLSHSELMNIDTANTGCSTHPYVLRNMLIAWIKVNISLKHEWPLKTNKYTLKHVNIGERDVNTRQNTLISVSDTSIHVKTH
jgi:hypothetical protein